MFPADLTWQAALDLIQVIGWVALVGGLGFFLTEFGKRTYRIHRENHLAGYPIRKKIKTPAGSHANIYIILINGRERCRMDAKIMNGDEEVFSLYLMEWLEEHQKTRNAKKAGEPK